LKSSRSSKFIIEVSDSYNHSDEGYFITLVQISVKQFLSFFETLYEPLRNFSPPKFFTIFPTLFTLIRNQFS